MHSHSSLCTLDYPRVLREPSPLGKPLRKVRKCMCRGDDHLEWKHLISSEACRGLRIIEGYDHFYQGSFNPLVLSYRAILTSQANLDPIKISLLHVGASVDLQSCLSHIQVQLPSPQSLFVVLKDWYIFEFHLGHLYAL